MSAITENALVQRVSRLFCLDLWPFQPLSNPTSRYLIQRFSNFFLSVQEEENDAHYEPVIKLTEQVETKTLEEDEDVLFKMFVLDRLNQMLPSTYTLISFRQAFQTVQIFYGVQRVEGTRNWGCPPASTQRIEGN
jgi:hypothetical protein